MTIAKVQGHIDAIERKLTKSIKIAEKGSSTKLGDVVKLGRKTNSIVSELKKGVAEYDVSTDPQTPSDAVTLRISRLT